MTSSETVEKLKPSTAVRYRLRSLLWAMIVVAAIASLGEVFLRGRSDATQISLLVFWGSSFTFFAICMSGYIWLRRRAEKKVGPLRFRLPWYVCIGTKLFSSMRSGIVFLIIVVLQIAQKMWFITHATEAIGSVQEIGSLQEFEWVVKLLWQFALVGIVPGILLAFSLINIWWSKELWVGEQGIAWLSSFRPWDKIKQWHSHTRHSDKLVLVTRRGRVAVSVLENERAQLTEFLQDKLGPPVAPGSAGG